MKNLNYQLKKLCRDNRDGGYPTQATRRRLLDLIANQLHELRFRRMQPKSLKPKLVDALVSLWKDQGIGVGTLKNRLAALRWWAKKVGEEGGQGQRHRRPQRRLRHRQTGSVARQSKARTLDEWQFSKISDPYVRLSIRLQASLGLRREEAIKFSPGYAIQGDQIRLKPSWTKAGRARTVPIRTDERPETRLRPAAL